MNEIVFRTASEAVQSAATEMVDALDFAERGDTRVACGLLLNAAFKIKQHYAAIDAAAESLAAISDGPIPVRLECYTSAHEAICEIARRLRLALCLPEGLSADEREQIYRQQLSKVEPLLQAVTPELCARIRRERAKLVTTTVDDSTWPTVSEVAREQAVGRDVITKAANSGKLRTNNKTGRARRIDPASLIKWSLKRADNN